MRLSRDRIACITNHLDRLFPYNVRDSSLACAKIRTCSLSGFRPARLIYNTSIDMAERKDDPLRRELLSADCLSDSAIFFGSVQVNTPFSRFRALLSLEAFQTTAFPVLIRISAPLATSLADPLRPWFYF
ncbi:MAG: hypothetical protein OEV89_05155 [Desulfobulbaceae bacterium]|nr:hypothetical protein [Desulfobulbaceae bacterium]